MTVADDKKKKHTAKIRFRANDNLNWQIELDLGRSSQIHTIPTYGNWTIDNKTSIQIELCIQVLGQLLIILN